MLDTIKSSKQNADTHWNREERARIVDEIFASWRLERLEPPQDEIQVALDYINGKITLDDVVIGCVK
jgi:hypothetical protein